MYERAEAAPYRYSSKFKVFITVAVIVFITEVGLYLADYLARNPILLR